MPIKHYLKNACMPSEDRRLMAFVLNSQPKIITRLACQPVCLSLGLSSENGSRRRLCRNNNRSVRFMLILCLVVRCAETGMLVVVARFVEIQWVWHVSRFGR